MINAKGLDDIPGFAGGDFASLGEYFDGTENNKNKQKKTIFEFNKVKAKEMMSR